jgi:hypothetical protein
LFLAIAILGALDTSAGFVGAMVFIIGSLLTVGHIPDTGEMRTMIGIMLVCLGPSMLTTSFRKLRKNAAFNFSAWWERFSDFAIAPFLAGWSVSAMVSGLPALAGLTLDAANHVTDFALFIAGAIIVRVALEEFAANSFPARLDKINPDALPSQSKRQKAIVLAIKYAVWVFIGSALIGPSWQIWAGSALFMTPAILGFFKERLPNSTKLWKILPTGIPGLALTLFVSSATTAIVGSVIGATAELGKWSFLILPLPLLLLSTLGLFGRHGRTLANGEKEDRPVKGNKWVYRIGGVVVLFLTLKLAGVI